ncbi:expressed unknown protein [Seminavis robusta]|uniref:EF-hand domain-containing protein n=1 Tax=Seminavis robusta TaxID=568900 RepID=A0A9N8DL46_9STRA|nr:expressed unknown protein [Seminavis robusta]|eukprot:Sro116_g057170.1 n/a (809) ;mRNA; f:88369-90795
MVLREGFQRLQRLLLGSGRFVGNSATASGVSATSTSRQAGRQIRTHIPRYHPAAIRPTGFLDVARFGLISIATLPFSLWVALFSYNYVYRIPLCQEALAKEDQEISFIRGDRYAEPQDQETDGTSNSSASSTSNSSSPMIGRERQLNEVTTLLSSAPHQIIVVAGANESGKSRFVSEIVKSVPLQRGITYLQLAQVADSLSTLTHALVRAFDLRWLSMRHSLVDVLPFAGSEIMVMKERFSDRDLAQALLVITEALKAKAASSNQQRPVILIDGLGEGSAWIRSTEGRNCLQRLLKWCIYITKERRLAHVVLTGSEELVISLTGENRITRGHVKVIGLADLTHDQAAALVRQEIPYATESDIRKIVDMFGGFIHDVQGVSREIQARLNQVDYNDNSNDSHVRDKLLDDVISARFRLQVERVTAAFAKGRQEDDHTDMEGNNNQKKDDEDEMDPYLDPLKAVYSEATAAEKNDDNNTNEEEQTASWSQLQLWQTLQRLVESNQPNMGVPFADLRDDVFGGDITPLLELMNEDVLGFDVESSSSSGSWSWEIKPATPALGRVFHHLVNSSHLKERFQREEDVQQSCEQKAAMERERRRLRRERQWLDLRKASLRKTVELGTELRVRRNKDTQRKLEKVYCNIVEEEVANEERGAELRKELEAIMLKAAALEEAKEEDAHKRHHGEKASGGDESKSASTISSKSPHDVQKLLKAAILHNYVQEGSKDKFARFRNAFEAMNSNSTDGIAAEDVVRLIKVTSGEDVDLEAAKSFIRAWDLNNDTSLDYDEFVRMLLTDPKNSKMMQRNATAKT